MLMTEIINQIADSLKQFDSTKPVHKKFKPGIGPFGEPQLVRHIIEDMNKNGIKAISKKTPDLQILNEWGLEIKIARPFVDNGVEAEDWSVNLLHPYPGHYSLMGDGLKLQKLTDVGHKGLVVIGFEHNPAKISLNPLFDAFELVARGVMKFTLSKRVEELRSNLVHPVHQVLRVIGWELSERYPSHDGTNQGNEGSRPQGQQDLAQALLKSGLPLEWEINQIPRNRP